MTDESERIADVQALVNALISNGGGAAKEDYRFSLLLPPSTPVDVTVKLEHHFPNIDVLVTSAQYATRRTHKSKFDPHRKEEERKAKAREIVAKLRERSQQKHNGEDL